VGRAVFEAAIKYLQHTERLIVITLTIFLAGLLFSLGETIGFFQFNGLPDWVRPTAVIVWVTAGTHVVIRTTMALGAGLKALSRFLIALPERRRRAAFDRWIVHRLLATSGLEREVLAYALYRDDNNIWVSRRNFRWVDSLLRKGLIEMHKATFEVTYYRINQIAWRYMQRYPNKFLHLVPWREAPWIDPYEERDAENWIAQAKKNGSVGLMPS
jgi:hypothetical protein